MSKLLRVAVCGATGAVGRELLNILEQRQFPATDVVLFASSRSVGSRLEFAGQQLKVRELREDSFQNFDLALFSAGRDISLKFVPIAAKSGCVVVDNSSAWRMDPAVPLVVPEVNPYDLDWHKGIIANPNCSTIQMVVALKPIHDVAKIKRIVVSTYQAVSGNGHKAIVELETQVRRMFNGQDVVPNIYPHQIAFNCLPQIDEFLDNGYTKEEMKIVNETKKIMGDDSIRVTATTARVPVFYGHSESVNVETSEKLTVRACRLLLAKAPSITVIDYPEKKAYPMPVYATGEDNVFVGRIREDESIENGLNIWIVSDNIRKGAALNTVQIGEELLRRDMV